jgi:hypothetical protein
MIDETVGFNMKITPPRGYKLSSPVNPREQNPHLIQLPYEYLRNEISVKTVIRGTDEWELKSKYYVLTTPSSPTDNGNTSCIHSHIQFFILEEKYSSNIFEFKLFEIEKERRCKINDDMCLMNNKIRMNEKGEKIKFVFEKNDDKEGILHSFNSQNIIFQQDRLSF